MDDIVSLTGAI